MNLSRGAHCRSAALALLRKEEWRSGERYNLAQVSVFDKFAVSPPTLHSCRLRGVQLQIRDERPLFSPFRAW